MWRTAATRAALCLLVAPALLAVTTTAARAQTSDSVPILALDFHAPPECGDAANVTMRVEELVGRARGEVTLVARARIAESSAPPRYRLELVIAGEGAPTARTMTGPDCGRLAEAAAVILALDIDPEALTQKPPPSEEPASETPRPPVVRAPAAPRREIIPPRSTRWIEVGAEARMLLDSGTLPRTTLGASAMTELAHENLSLQIGVTAYEHQFARAVYGGAGGAYVDLTTASLHGCGRQILASIGLSACLGGELGSEGTRGVGIAHPGSSAAFWGALSASLQARAWPSRRISPTAGITFGHPIAAPNVEIQNLGTLFEAPAFFVRAYVGLEARIF